VAGTWAAELEAVIEFCGAGFAAAGFENMLNGFCMAESSDELKLVAGFCGLESATAVADGFGVVGCVSAGG
jgi:hypothetical protein